MSSIGASYAHVHVQQKRQKDKMKKMEEQRAAKNGTTENRVIVNSNKVHPGNFMSHDMNPTTYGGRRD